MARTILIPGYVEDPCIFDALAAQLPGDSPVRLHLADEFRRWQPRETVSAHTLAAYLTQAHGIGPSDLIIGHSMGGWIAAHLKAQTGARAIQLASFTDQRKVVNFTRNPYFLHWIARLGLAQTRAMGNYLKGKYPFEESRTLFNGLIDGMRTLDRRYIDQQLQVLFAPSPPLTVMPDLRIHARRDNIVRPPDEPYTEVPGDHFSLVFHSVDVAETIKRFLPA